MTTQTPSKPDTGTDQSAGFDPPSEFDAAEVMRGYGVPLSADALLSLGCMEGLFEGVVTPAVSADEAPRPAAHWPGYVLAGGVALAALAIHLLPIPGVGVVSTAILAILLGLVIRSTISLPQSVNAGCKHIVKKGIPVAIVCTGAGLNFLHLRAIGPAALGITVVCIGVAVAAGYYAARWLGLGTKTAWLLGVGTGICGNSAIVAVAPLIDADDDDLVLSVGTVNLLGLVAMLLWPLLGGWMVMSDVRFGVWSGTSIHAVPQVVAAGFAYSPEAGALATLVKLVRVALLAPLVCLLAVVHARQHATDAESGNRSGPVLIVHYAQLVPWFVWGFLILAGLNTLGLIPTIQFELADFLKEGEREMAVSVGAGLATTGKILLTLAMAAIGLEVNVRQLASVGGRVLTAGLVSTVVLGAVSLGLVWMML